MWWTANRGRSSAGVQRSHQRHRGPRHHLKSARHLRHSCRRPVEGTPPRHLGKEHLVRRGRSALHRRGNRQPETVVISAAAGSLTAPSPADAMPTPYVCLARRHAPPRCNEALDEGIIVHNNHQPPSPGRRTLRRPGNVLGLTKQVLHGIRSAIPATGCGSIICASGLSQTDETRLKAWTPYAPRGFM